MPASPSFASKLLVAAAAIVASVVFAAAEGGATPLVILPAALIAIFVVDSGPKLALPNWAAGVVGVVAIYLSVREFFSEDIEGRLLSGGHLLSYLTAIVLLQRKRLGDLYRIVTLSGLQVALSSVLTNEFWLAGSLLFFLAFTIWALSVLLWERLAAGPVADGRLKRQPSIRLAGPSLLFAVVAFAVGSVLFLLLPRIWVGNFQMFNNDAAPGSISVGFTDQVSLGDIGQIMESDDPVLEIETFDEATGQPASLERWFADECGTEPMFRGAVLSDYVGGAWEGNAADNSLGTPGVPKVNDTLLRHEIYLHPIGTRRLFTVGPAAVLGDRDTTEPLQLSYFDMTLQRAAEEPTTEPAVYTLWSSKKPAVGVSPMIRLTRRNTPRQVQLRMVRLSFAPQEIRRELVDYLRTMPEMQSAYELVRRRLDAVGVSNQIRRELIDYGYLDSRFATIDAKLRANPTDPQAYDLLVDSFPLFILAERLGLRETASSLVIADSIRSHFDRPEFTYTLDANVSDDTIDPILDFLRNRRTGHCEYYASANALLLKAAGIPARLVSGFKGGYEPEVGRYEVSQLHAHAWCEAIHLVPAPQGFELVVQTYDPTPATRADAVLLTQQEAAERRRNPLVFFRDLWANGVFMTRTEQQTRIYNPIREGTAELWQSVEDFPDAVNALFSREQDRLSPQQQRSLRNVGWMVFAVAASVVGFILLRRWRRKWLAKRAAAENATARNYNIPPTPWYDRFLAVARERIGRRRPANDTHREYVDEIRQSDAELTPVAETATSEYYRVRFGRKPADPTTLDAVAGALDQLADEPTDATASR